ncbi:MaoC family dehydratase [Sansalvadorimonas sp. 2012CJ34-2]|uniref:MaoC family dehydratase n=1 Tax=Parendozoicomonas callyspongiae TaxID=2942213 RepID=A0ABT0PLT1_9GAMM|nr:MaoC family dehydratase [Sansalvadorimonas sp. 2012CJ34-2]MCL6272206.1 MaoC family dehydratase [Sansalvadorimonas sp. 2012CJ34-2]
MDNKLIFDRFTIEDLSIGMGASYSQTITDTDIKAFAGISGDNNPVHMSDEYAENSRFKKRIAHGLMSASFFSALFGTKIPGPGCVYVSQTLNFKKPVYLNDTVTAKVTVTDIDLKRKRVFFKTECKVKARTVITGEAEIYIP